MLNFLWTLPMCCNNFFYKYLFHRFVSANFHGNHRNQRLQRAVLAGAEELLASAVQQSRTSSIRHHFLRPGNRWHLLHVGSTEVHETTRPREPADCCRLDVGLHPSFHTDWTAEDALSIWKDGCQAIENFAQIRAPNKYF